MSKTARAFVAAIAGLGVLATSLAATAQPRDLVGARAGQGESSLRSRGYQLDHTDGGVQYWWHPGNSECINLFVDNGRYDTIDRRPNSECNNGRGGGKKDNTGAIVAGALAIGILAAAAASSKKKHDDDRYRDDDRRRDPPYSPARGVDCYPSQRACYERGRGYSASWTSREFGYRY